MGPAAELLSRTRPRPSEGSRGRAATHGHRRDIDGLRAVAVLSVVLFHVGVPWLSGGYVGVDVFFVISGFLITGLLLAEARRSGRISLAGFYARRARRLLPLSALVLAAAAAATVLVLPPLVRPDVGQDVLAGAGFFSNWRFAVQATDYMAADVDKSPLLHYWSLSVEEQFYVLWPLLIMALLGPRLRRSRTARHADVGPQPAAGSRELPVARIGVGLGVLGAVSLALSARTSDDPGSWAYFGLHTRAWELACGAGLALAVPAVSRLAGPARLVLGWAGLGAILVSALTFDGATVFPGLSALVPVLGTAALIAAGTGAAPGRGRPLPAAGEVLSGRLMVGIGGISYGWYLWHWPTLIVLRDVWPGSPVRVGVVTFAVSLTLAVVSHVAVEQPVREARRLRASVPRSLALGAGLVVASLGVGLLLRAAPPPTSAKLVQSPQQARQDDGRALARACNVDYDSTAASADCVFGDPAARRTVVLVGDSHAENWFWAAEAWARQSHVRLYAWTKSSCPLAGATMARSGREYTACTQWRANVFRRLSELGRVDTVLLARAQHERERLLARSGSGTLPAGDVAEVWREGMAATLRSLAPHVGSVVILQDTPWPPGDILSCISEHVDDPHHCDYPREPAVGRDAVFTDVEKALVGGQGIPPLAFLDTTRIVCPAATCPAVTPQGQIIYRDYQHLSVAYSASQGVAFGAAVDAAVKPLGRRG